MPLSTPRSRLGVGGRLLLAFFGISAFSVLAAAAAIYAFWVNQAAFDRITGIRVPTALDSLELSRQAERIVAAAPSLLTAGSTGESEAISTRIRGELERLDQLMREITEQDAGSDSDRRHQPPTELAAAVAEIGSNLTALDRLVARRLAIAERKGNRIRQLADTHTAMQRLLAPWLLTTEATIARATDSIGQDGDDAGGPHQAAEELATAVAALDRLQDVQVATTVINDTLIKAASMDDASRLDIVAFRVNRTLAETERRIAGFHPKLTLLVETRLDEYRTIALSPEGLIETRREELDLLESAERLIAENQALSGRLTEGVDRLVADAQADILQSRRDAEWIQRISMTLLLVIGALALLSSVLIVWRYVGRNLVSRLSALTDSMLAIAGGDLEVAIPAGGQDEIGRMADALTVFRDTAVEVRKTNLRELQEARRRLTDAIESISEGFSLFDAEDRLVVRNSRFVDLYPGLDTVAVAGAEFRVIVESAETRGLISGAADDAPDRIRRRLDRHREPGDPFLQSHSDGRWIQISERATSEGGTVAVYTDVTALKQAEQTASAAREQAEGALAELKRTQSSLVQAEKLAQLGQLVAGIAHELKNPLNFVGNFAEVSAELIDELKQRLAQHRGQMDAGIEAEFDELLSTLVGNLERIREHGMRADRIIRSMLAHSRGGSGDWQPVDLNALVADSMNLAYHGARATDPGFDIELERHFDDDLGTVTVVPQDISRVCLNLLGNGFDATRERSRREPDSGYRPTMSVTTRSRGDRVEVLFRDNGGGVPDEVASRIFSPFFTTKPAGEGTGLGLSLSFDIIVHEHRGDLTLRTEPGDFAEFTISLPRHSEDAGSPPGATA